MKKIVYFGRSLFQYNGFDSLKLILSDCIKRSDFIYVEPRKTVGLRWIEAFKQKRGFRKWDSIFGTPCLNSAYKSYLDCSTELDKEEEIIFVFVSFELWYFGKNGFLDYLKRKYPNSKTVYHLLNTNKVLKYDMESFKKNFDRVMTFDEEEYKKYDLYYCPNMAYGKNSFTKNEVPKSDCFYVGNAKNRYKEIQDIFEKLTKAGLKCEFFIINCPKEMQVFSESIHYDVLLNYDDVLKYVEKTKIIYENVQEGQTSATLRLPESYVYRKKLLTNNNSMRKSKFYGDGFIFTYVKLEDIDVKTIIERIPKYNEYNDYNASKYIDRIIASVSERG